MTQTEISSAINAIYILRPSPGDFNEEEYYKQKELFNLACEDFCMWVHQASDHDMFDVLFPLACSRTGIGAFAAHVLFYLKPVCPISCADALRVVSQSDWDISLEELPWYLAAHFGNDAMRSSLAQLETEDYIKEVLQKREAWFIAHAHLNNDIRRGMPPGDAWVKLDTIRYWLENFVREQGDLLTNWKPLWRWQAKGAKR